MNETIKKILSNAKDYTMCNDPALLHHAISGVFVEKFAELIIKETLEVVRDEVQYALDDYLADTIDIRVKNHFGIK